MTLVSQIITDAFRQSNLVSINTAVTSAQQTESLRYLNRILASVYGNEAGEELQEFPLGQDNIVRPAGFPWFGNTPPAQWVVPKDALLVCNLTASSTVYLNPYPNDGTRLGVSNPANNLATNTLTLNGNGRTIQGADTLVLNTNGQTGTWFYRGDIADWVKVQNVLLSDTFPFPPEFEDLFVSMLAMRLNPAYGTQMDPQTVEVMKRSMRQFKSRYSIIQQVGSELGLQRMPRTTQDRYYWSFNPGSYDPTSSFNSGWPY